MSPIPHLGFQVSAKEPAPRLPYTGSFALFFVPVNSELTLRGHGEGASAWEERQHWLAKTAVAVPWEDLRIALRRPGSCQRS